MPLHEASEVCVHPPVPSPQHAPTGGQRSAEQGCAGKNTPAQELAIVMLQPFAPQHAPCVFGHGSGLHGALAVKTEPKGQSDWVMKAHPPA